MKLNKTNLFFLVLYGILSMSFVAGAAVNLIGGNLYYDNAGYLSIGTSTPHWNFSIAAARPTIVLTDTLGGTNTKHWMISSQNGYFYVSTSSDSYASSTQATFGLSDKGLMSQSGTLPTIATSTGAGTTGTTTVTGAPNFATITVQTGASPSANATIVTVTLPSPCWNNPVPVLSPSNLAASQISSSTRNVFATSTTNSAFIIKSGALGLLANTSYNWNAFIGCF